MQKEKRLDQLGAAVAATAFSATPVLAADIGRLSSWNMQLKGDAPAIADTAVYAEP